MAANIFPHDVGNFDGAVTIKKANIKKSSGRVHTGNWCKLSSTVQVQMPIQKYNDC